jgi:hypothetical protein
MNAEEWRPIAGFPDYFVNRHGEVLSLKRGGPRILRGSVDDHGYRAVGLRRDGRLSIQRVHRLMVTAFYGPRDSETQTRHLDGNRLNNDLRNLTWGTRSDNMRDKLRHGTDHNASKSHCPTGHEYTAANTYVARQNQRHCRRCHRDSQRAYVTRQAQRAAGIRAA